MFAATENCPSRKRLLIGEVDDENAFAMGGVAGHAGLFAPVREVDRIAAELIACYKGRSKPSCPRKSCANSGPATERCPARPGRSDGTRRRQIHSSSGHHFPPTAVGHLGFTGTSIWIDPEREIAVSILTNRVHPSRDNQAIREFRPKHSRPDHGGHRRCLIRIASARLARVPASARSMFTSSASAAPRWRRSRGCLPRADIVSPVPTANSTNRPPRCSSSRRSKSKPVSVRKTSSPRRTSSSSATSSRATILRPRRC